MKPRITTSPRPQLLSTNFMESDFNSPEFISDLTGLVDKQDDTFITLSHEDFGKDVVSIIITNDGGYSLTLRLQFKESLSGEGLDPYYGLHTTEGGYGKNILFPWGENKGNLHKMSQDFYSALKDFGDHTRLLRVPNNFASCLSKPGEDYWECKDRLDNAGSSITKASEYGPNALRDLFDEPQS